MARRTANARIQPEPVASEAAAEPRQTRSEQAPAALDGARLAQAMLAARLANGALTPASEPRWSRRRGLALAVGASALLWMGFALVVRSVLVG